MIMNAFFIGIEDWSKRQRPQLELLETDEKHVLNSKGNEFKNKNHLRIENTNLNAERVAKLIKDEFSLGD